MHKKLIVALTGGIGCGKSTVANLFADLGVTVIDADKIARETVTPYSKILKQIRQHFGDDIIDEQGQLKRTVLRDKIFETPEERRWLENLLHPTIIQQMQKDLLSSSSPYCILVIPLLFETNPNFSIDRILVVDAREETQINRALTRDKISRESVLKIMQSQVSREVRIEGADDVITNEVSLEHLAERVKELHEKYLSLAEA